MNQGTKLPDPVLNTSGVALASEIPTVTRLTELKCTNVGITSNSMPQVFFKMLLNFPLLQTKHKKNSTHFWHPAKYY